MSDIRHYAIHCDFAHCTDRVMGEAGESPSKIRPRIANYGWVSRFHPPTATQKELGIVPSYRDDYCPFHAFKIKES